MKEVFLDIFAQNLPHERIYRACTSKKEKKVTRSAELGNENRRIGVEWNRYLAIFIKWVKYVVHSFLRYFSVELRNLGF